MSATVRSCHTCRHRFIEHRGGSKLDVCFHESADRMGSNCSAQVIANGACGYERRGYEEAADKAASLGVVLP